MSASPTPEVRAGGGVVHRQVGDRLEVLLVHRPRYDDWTLPKGKLDPGETWREGARREVAEETGLVCDPGPRVATVHYRDAHGRTKEVRYFAMVAPATHAPFVPNDEVDALAWLDVEGAADRLSYARDLEVLETFTRVAPGP